MATYIEKSKDQKCPSCNSFIEFICDLQEPDEWGDEVICLGERCSTCKWEMSFEDGDAIRHPFGTLHKENKQ